MCFSCISLILDTAEAENMSERNIIEQFIADILLNYNRRTMLLVLGATWAFHLVSQVNRWQPGIIGYPSTLLEGCFRKMSCHLAYINTVTQTEIDHQESFSFLCSRRSILIYPTICPFSLPVAQKSKSPLKLSTFIPTTTRSAKSLLPI
jgi:hypothetical protein